MYSAIYVHSGTDFVRATGVFGGALHTLAAIKIPLNSDEERRVSKVM